MNSARYYLSDLFPNQTTISVSTNSPITIGSGFYDCGNELVIKKAIIHLESSTNISGTFELFYIDNNEEIFIDRLTISSKIGEFDFTKYLHIYKSHISNLIIRKLTSGTTSFLLSSNKSYIDVEYISLNETRSEEYIKDEITKTISCSFNVASDNLKIVKKLFGKALPYNLSLHFDNHNSGLYHSFFPNGWKLSLLDYLDITYLNNQIDHITLVDAYNNRHNLVPLCHPSNSTNVVAYYTNDGSALILIPQIDGDNNVTYKLTTGLTEACKIFDESGKLIGIYGNKYSDSIEISYNTNLHDIEITDYRNNTIFINHSSSNGTISITLNSLYSYILNVNNDNLLTSISYGNNSNSFTYNLDGKIASISNNNVKKFEVTYTNEQVSNIAKYNGQYLISSYAVSHDYFKTYLTDNHNVKYFYYFDDELKTISKGETVNGEDDTFLLDTHDIEIEDAYLAINNLVMNKYKKGPFLSGSDVFQLNTSSSSLENVSLILDFSTGIGISNWKKGKKYLLIATLTKNVEHNVPLTSDREAYITIKFEDSSAERFDFDPYLQKQTIVKAFTAKKNSSPTVKAYAKGMKDFGGVTFSKICIASTAGKACTYFASEDSDPIISNQLFPTIYTNENTFNGIKWYPLSDYDDGATGDNTDYSFEDLKYNFIANVIHSPFYWENNFKTLTYAAQTRDGQSNYRFKTKNIYPDSCLMYGKKTMITRKSLSNKISFEYIRFNNNRFIYNKVFQKGSVEYTFTKKYDLNLRLVEESGDYGVTKVYHYNIDGNVDSIETHGDSNQFIKTEFEYDSNLRCISQDDGIVFNGFQYVDAFDLVSEKEDGNENVEEYSYNDEFDELTEIEKDDSSITNEYDCDGKLTSSSNDSELVIEYDNYGFESNIYISGTNDSNYNLCSIVRTLGQADLLTKNGVDYHYNKYDNLQAIAKNSNQDSLCEFYYFKEKPDNPSSVSEQDEDELIKESKLYVIDDKFSSQKSLIDYDYDDNISEVEVGNISDNTYSFSYKSSFEYDEYGRLSSVINNYSNNVLNIMNRIKTDYTYADNFSELVSQIMNNVGALLYDGYHQKTKVDYTWDSLLRPNTICYSVYTRSDDTVQIRYRDEYSYLNVDSNQTTSYISRIDYYQSQGGVANLIKSTYINYDNNGQISSIRYGDLNGANNNTGVSYSYDSCDRLVSENNVELGKNITYVYDDNGNIQSATKTDVSNPNNTETDIYLYDSIYKDRLWKFNNKEIIYDSLQRPISYGSDTIFGWIDNQLRTISINNNQTSFKYNYQGIRTEKISPNGIKHEYLLNGKTIISEKIIDSNNNVSYITYQRDTSGVYGITYNGYFYFLKRNILGDIEYIYHGDDLVARYIYDAFGNHIVVDPNGDPITDMTHIGNVNPFRYRGYYYDIETGLYYCNLRYYNPLWRRWISPDDISNIEIDSIDGINLFAYCKNNPIKFTDPNGSFDIVCAIVGAVIGAVLAICSLSISDAIVGRISDWKNYLIAGIFGAISGFLTGGFISTNINPYLLASINGTLSVANKVAEMELSDQHYSCVDKLLNYLVAFAIGFSTSLISSTISSILDKTKFFGYILDNTFKTIIYVDLSHKIETAVKITYLITKKSIEYISCVFEKNAALLFIWVLNE